MDPSASTPDPVPPARPPSPPSIPGLETQEPSPDPRRVWLHRDGQTFGPYRREELHEYVRTGRAGADDLVCPESGDTWIPLRELEPGFPFPAPPANPVSAAPPRFHHVAPWLFLVLSLATVGLYPFWWFWRCWREAARRQPTDASGNRIMPFWRGFFGIFWFHALCRRIEEDRGRTPTAAAALCALAFFAFTLCKRLPDPWWLLQLASILPAMYPVVLVDRLNRDAGTPSPRRSRLRWWQFPFATGGLLICTMVVLDGLGITPSSRVLTGTELSYWHRSWLQKHEMLGPDESPLYFYSAGLLWLDTDGNLVTDRGLVSYYEDEETGERVTFRADFDEIHRIEVIDATGWPDDTTIKVWTDGNTGEDDWFSLIFSPESDVDNDVIQTLRERVGPDRVKLVSADEDEGPDAPKN